MHKSSTNYGTWWSVVGQRSSSFPRDGQIIIFAPTPGAPQEEASAPHFLFGATEPGL